MKKPLSLKIGPRALEAIPILRRFPDIDVDRGRRSELNVDGRRTPLHVEFKRRIDPAGAWGLIQECKSQPREAHHVLLVVDRISDNARRILVENGINVADGAGNADVRLPGARLIIRGAQLPTSANLSSDSPRLSGKAGVVTQAILLDHLRQWKLTDIAATAAVSVGLVHGVLARLDRAGITRAVGAGPRSRRLVEQPTALLDLWLDEAIDRRLQRTKAFVLARSPRDLVSKLDGSLTRAKIDHAISGVAAASHLAPLVTAIPITELWISQAVSPAEAVAAMGGELVDTGHNVVLLQSVEDEAMVFRTKESGVWLANRFRVLLDTVHDSGRAREQAEQFRKEVIGF